MDRGKRPDAINTRWIFWAYAGMAGLAGLVLVILGPMWFGGAPRGSDKAALIRIAGSIMIAAGCCGAGFAAVDHPVVRRRALFWFALAHTAISVVVTTQEMAIWGRGTTVAAAQALLALALVLFYLWGTSEGEFPRGPLLVSLFAGAKPGSAESLRSQYEHQIREAARQEERNRLARDLHDSIKQEIFVIQTAAATVQTRFDEDPSGARQALEQVRTSARRAITEMQVMLDQLRAESLENGSLIEALKAQCEALGFRTGAHVEFNPGDLPPSEALAPGGHEAILRAGQEALANIGRHARAANVVVSLSAAREHVELRIRDDGAGFDANQAGRGQGLANMRARAAELGGEFELISRPGHGTSIAFSIPYVTAEPREYLQKAIMSVVLLLWSVFMFDWTQAFGAAAVATVMAIGVFRFVRAYRRTRRMEAGR